MKYLYHYQNFKAPQWDVSTFPPWNILLTPVNPDLHFDEKYCIFVVRKWGDALNQVFPFYFALKSGEKSQDFVKISRRLVEKKSNLF